MSITPIAFPLNNRKITTLDINKEIEYFRIKKCKSIILLLCFPRLSQSMRAITTARNARPKEKVPNDQQPYHSPIILVHPHPFEMDIFKKS
jgi:hypothetical protein